MHSGGAVIISFAHKPTAVLWGGEAPPEIPPSILSTAHRKLTQLDAAQKLDDLRVPPNNRLEALKGDRKGQYSIRVNKKYRVCFGWRDGNAYDVEIVDYH